MDKIEIKKQIVTFRNLGYLSVVSILLMMLSIYIMFKTGSNAFLSITLPLSYLSSITFIIYSFKHDNFTSRIISISIFVLLASPVLIYVIVVLVRFFEARKLIYYVGDSKTWIGFGGSIIGGLATMLGIYFTLDYDSKNKKSERSLSNSPFIECDKIDEKRLYIDFTKDDLFIVKNVHTSIVRDFFVSQLTIINSDTNETVIEIDCEKGYCGTNIITDSTTHIFTPFIKYGAKITEALFHSKPSRITLKITCEYLDITRENIHTHHYSQFFKCSARQENQTIKIVCAFEKGFINNEYMGMRPVK